MGLLGNMAIVSTTARLRPQILTQSSFIGRARAPATAIVTLAQITLTLGSRARIEAVRPSGSRTVPVRPLLAAEVKFFGRYRTGVIQDGVLRLVVPVV